jgi:energy-coupling factor transporter ATP-binding protein EcfA2
MADASSFEHPIQRVAGEFCKLSDVLELKLADNDNAFSVSTRDALKLAARYPSARTETGAPVIDAASMLYGILEKGRATPGNDSASVLATFLEQSGGTATPHAPMEASWPDLGGVIVAPSLTRALSVAADCVRTVTKKQTRIDLRHAVTTVLGTAEAQRALLHMRGTDMEAAEFFSELSLAMQRFVASDKADELDDPGAWRAVLGRVSLHPEAAAEESTSELHYAGDRPEENLVHDALGIGPELRALAEVMCLRSPGPPLAIGLFGDWGSGKSTFMNMLQGAIESVQQRARSPELKDLFVEDVVAIKLNAWHYTDANLWASLTAEFFDQLRGGGYKRSSANTYQSLVDEVAARVTAREGEASVRAMEALEKKTEAQKQRGELEALQLQRDTARFRLALDSYQELRKRKPDAVANALAAIGVEQAPDVKAKTGSPVPPGNTKQAGGDKESEEPDSGMVAARELIEGAVGLAGRARTLAQAFWTKLRRGNPWVLGSLLLFVVAVVVIARGHLTGFGGSLDLPDWVDWPARVTALAAFATAFGTTYHAVAPLFVAATAYRKKLKEEHQTLDARLQEKRVAINKLERQAAEATAEGTRAAASAARFRGGTAAAALDFFLHEKEETRSFSKDVGIVSRVRQAFEQLDAIVTKRAEARAAGEAGPGAAFERIILYIDDLDRCQPEHVVQVLQAVHLLLAFPLFVVVVGVDARWLRHSLAEYYKDRLLPADASITTASERATVLDYLEKIFQIPVWLPRLTFGEKGNFARLVESVAGPVERPVPTSGQREASSAGPGAATGSARRTIEPVQVRSLVLAESPHEQKARVVLRAEELKLMQQLGAFAGKSPRAVKRFVNLYRLVRGTRRGPELGQRFLSGTGMAGQPDHEAPLYPAVMFWLAASVGLSAHQLVLLRTAVGVMDEKKQGIPGLSMPIKPLVAFRDGRKPMQLLESDPWPHIVAPNGWTELRSFWETVPLAARNDYVDALDALEEKLPGPAGHRALKQAIAETARFSFVYR